MHTHAYRGVHLRAHTHILRYIPACIHRYTQAYTCTHAHIGINLMHTYIYIYTDLYLHVCKHIHKRIPACTHMYTQAYTYTYTHTFTLA